MTKKRYSRIILLFTLSIGFIFLISGCAKQPSIALIEQPATVEQEVVAMEQEVPLAEAESVLVGSVQEPELAGYHVVKKGECLWWIAEYEDVYNDPFMWPLIYTANTDQIVNPDLIYPDQKLKIPRGGYTIEEVKEARQRAGAPRPYTPPGEALAPAN
ncbi:MAG: LysM peptidoglycan-binding domain-containing protein [Deltaproteobacteria bacterium]|nr:LysM peptidoglycan-binding domain-containing protein [Deltaproteobacteria bacterium]